jgi:hypothetical protein
MTWDEWLRELMCRLYQVWGGDCAELGIVPNPAIPKLHTAVMGGPFPNLKAEEREQLALDVTALADHLKLSGNNLDPAYNAMLDEVIAYIQSELGP